MSIVPEFVLKYSPRSFGVRTRFGNGVFKRHSFKYKKI